MMYSIFFFKQKTAYEMHISDWSSDVCSSDLLGAGRSIAGHFHVLIGHVDRPAQVQRRIAVDATVLACDGCRLVLEDQHAAKLGRDVVVCPRRSRSEEHTSELQSLMRISYAVFCLKKKNNDIQMTYNAHKTE